MRSPRINPTTGRRLRATHQAAVEPRGFSMIELLVVLAVVMLLTGLLMPGLRSARHSAYSVICGANERQIGIGFLLYSEDHSGHLPVSLLQNQGEFSEMMAVTTGDLGETGGIPGYDGLGKLWELRYLDNPRCLHCPAHRHKHTFESNEMVYESLTGSVMQRVFANYHYTGHSTLESCLEGPTRERRNMNRNDKFVLLTDGLRTRQDFNHQTGMNVLYADGHYEYEADTGNRIANALPSEGGLFGSGGLSTYNETISNIWLRIDIDG
ncbi:MAG: prepilin-type N-terminal cleavage/methylation domain-containing protein [Phycisphaerales bacterium]|nr:prepilin-type N-terminal cleavage/methylation domain-containing protein [Phycisphaerales bacterium]